MMTMLGMMALLKRADYVADQGRLLSGGIAMIRVAIACTAAATAVVAFYGLKDTTAKDWILTGIPAWLQGVGTIGAAVLAFEAYANWRGQEVAKRKAEVAERILRAAHV